MSGQHFDVLCTCVLWILCLQEYEKKQREEERQKQLDDFESVRQAHSRYVQKVGYFEGRVLMGLGDTVCE